MVDLQRFLSKRFGHDPHVQVYIKADPVAEYSMFINTLDLVRQVGIPNVSRDFGRFSVGKYLHSNNMRKFGSAARLKQ